MMHSIVGMKWLQSSEQNNADEPDLQRRKRFDQIYEL